MYEQDPEARAREYERRRQMDEEEGSTEYVARHSARVDPEDRRRVERLLGHEL